MALKVGLIVGREGGFPAAFVEEVNRRGEGVVAEYVKLGTPRMDDPVEYAVIVDRSSHEVPFYRSWLKHAVLQGVTVVNNPFMLSADDGFLGAALAAKLGIASPKTVVLPHREYGPGIVHEESLRNLEYPLDWQAVADHVGMPCILRNVLGVGRGVHVCWSLGDLLRHYDGSGRRLMLVREHIEWEHFVRCLCIGQEEVLPMKYNPHERRHHVDHEHLSPELGRRIVDDSLALVRALGYDLASVGWAVRDGVPYAVDLADPVPDLDVESLTPHYFEWAVRKTADLAIRLAQEPRAQGSPLRWDALIAGRRRGVATGARLTGQADLDGAGDLAEELPSLAQGLPRSQV